MINVVLIVSEEIDFIAMIEKRRVPHGAESAPLS